MLGIIALLWECINCPFVCSTTVRTYSGSPDWSVGWGNSIHSFHLFLQVKEGHREYHWVLAAVTFTNHPIYHSTSPRYVYTYSYTAHGSDWVQEHKLWSGTINWERSILIADEATTMTTDKLWYRILTVTESRYTIGHGNTLARIKYKRTAHKLSAPSTSSTNRLI